MLDPLGDQSHSVPDHEDARRDRDLAAHIDQDPVAAREERLHRVPVDGDHPQIFRPGPEFMLDEGIGEKPRRLGLLHLFVPGPRARRRADVDLGHRAVAPRNGARAGRGRLWTRFPIRGPGVLDLFGAAAQVLRQRLAVVLGQDAGRAPVDELVQIGCSNPRFLVQGD